MKCSKCETLGLKSTVYHRGTISTLMASAPYWDEEGIYHLHDLNTYTSSYDCSEKHQFVVSKRPECPQGDYP